MIVGIKLRSNFDVPMNFGMDCVNGSIRDDRRVVSNAAFPHPEDCRLPHRSAPQALFLPLVPVRFFAADKAFVDLDRAAQFIDFVVRSARLQQPRSINQADFWVADFLRQCIEEMPLRAVTSKYIA